MKTFFILFLILFHINLAISQIAETGTRYVLGRHGVEITLEKKWNFLRYSEDSYEILYGCSGAGHCANIQVGFEMSEKTESVQPTIDKVIEGWKTEYPGLVYNQTSLTISGLELTLVDYYLRKPGTFYGQTVTLFKTENELVSFVFTGSAMFNNAQAINKYSLERSRFLKVLQTIKIKKAESVPVPESSVEIVSCSDTSYVLTTQMDSLKCYVRIPGKICQKTSQNSVVTDGIILKSLLLEKKPFATDKNKKNTDGGILVTFIYAMCSELYYAANPGSRSKFNFALTGIDLSNGKAAFLFYLTENNRNIFVSTIIDEYIYTICIVRPEGWSVDRSSEFISSIVKTLSDNNDAMDNDKICKQ